MGDHHARFRAMIEMVSGIRGLFRLFRLFYDIMLKSHDKLIKLHAYFILNLNLNEYHCYRRYRACLNMPVR